MNPNATDLRAVVFGDLERELKITRSVLERLPEEKWDWQPHVKSMSLVRLALHVADLPNWIRLSIAQDVLDMATAPRLPPTVANRQELLTRFDQNVTELRAAVAAFDLTTLNRPWTMRNGEQEIVTRPRLLVYRVWCLNHLIHHRGQLCLYLRLLDVPVPTVYFNTADNPGFVFE